MRVEIPPEYQNESTDIDTLAKYIRFHTLRAIKERNVISDIAALGNSSILVASYKGLYCINPLKEAKTAAFESTITGSILDTAIIQALFWQERPSSNRLDSTNSKMISSLLSRTN